MISFVSIILFNATTLQLGLFLSIFAIQLQLGVKTWGYYSRSCIVVIRGKRDGRKAP